MKRLFLVFGIISMRSFCGPMDGLPPLENTDCVKFVWVEKDGKQHEIRVREDSDLSLGPDAEEGAGMAFRMPVRRPPKTIGLSAIAVGEELGVASAEENAFERLKEQLKEEGEAVHEQRVPLSVEDKLTHAAKKTRKGRLHQILMERMIDKQKAQ